MEEILRLSYAFSIFILGEVPLLDVLLENRAFPLDEISQQTNQQQFVFTFDALWVKFVHSDNGFDDLSISNYQDVIVLQFGSCI